MIKIKSVYDRPSREDGFRILIEPSWPKGVTRKAAACDWMKSLGPSQDLRAWMNRNPRKLDSFRDSYLGELGRNDEAVDRVCALLAERGTITLLHLPGDDPWQIPETLASYLRARCSVD